MQNESDFPVTGFTERLPLLLTGDRLKKWESGILQHAKEMMMKHNEVQPVLFIAAIDPDNSKHTLLFTIDQRSFPSTAAVRPFIQNIAKRYKVYAYCMCAEAWLKEAKLTPEDDVKSALKKCGPIKDSLARKECIITAIEGKSYKRSTFVRIERDADGKPVLGESIFIEDNEQTGNLCDALYEPPVTEYVN